jgi:hypothetical protein
MFGGKGRLDHLEKHQVAASLVRMCVRDIAP